MAGCELSQRYYDMACVTASLIRVLDIEMNACSLFPHQFQKSSSFQTIMLSDCTKLTYSLLKYCRPSWEL